MTRVRVAKEGARSEWVAHCAVHYPEEERTEGVLVARVQRCACMYRCGRIYVATAALSLVFLAGDGVDTNGVGSIPIYGNFYGFFFFGSDKILDKIRSEWIKG